MEAQTVVFLLGGESYGLDISAVYEIIRQQPVTAVPQTPPFVEGVINLRGRIIPVVDLRDRFGLAGDSTADGRIVVADASGARVGLMVDSVSEVLMIPAEAIEPLPAVTLDERADYVRGIARVGEELILLLDLDRLFSLDEQGGLAA